ncbi:molybdopterin-guanine dinucleotide biosynthesis protein B [Methanoregula boonei 6A8]|jgi:molybdopterin-guanine dinucleotide biosynthesis protein MobB|uniref:Molybdopterin-guanine dinucleotide biosynthesis protein B n=1 Tax=Methanoregula boonei (strain DSM 21154 / JCM 14090 / 6A8) TaxID=456442 RepID=A7I672_METB6|nr:molybdopterin-guanine dinucleotide biosynthesis protein B [Methanoregula boonei]ABS55233.1 molybdopterin-guanine dinucleotide biosynthesis protein B [Methanoregula boonei 6A8]
MKIIPVTGRSNSGKTTFICKLIPELKIYGTVGVIKHLGDHEYRLEEGKDTTLFFENGADLTTGIDAGKSVVTFRSNSLDMMLYLYKQQDIDFAVIEGFKKYPFPKIVIGDLQDDTGILRNPTVDQVIASLSSFEDY